MDSLHAIGFYVSATLSVGAALSVAFLPKRTQRGLATAAVGLGLAGLDLSLSAGYAGAAAFVCYAVIGLLVAGPRYGSVLSSAGALSRQAGAVGAAALLAALAYAAFRGDFVHASFYGGAFGAITVGSELFGHDAMSTEAVGALVLVALVGATAIWRKRERGR